MLSLDAEDLHHLSDFFSRRFSTPASRVPFYEADLLPDADPLPSDAWTTLLKTPRSRWKLATLALSLRPNDPRLGEVCQLLLREQQRQHSRFTALGAGIGGAAITFILFVAFRPEPPTPPPPELVSTAPPPSLAIIPVPRPLPPETPAPTTPAPAAPSTEPPSAATSDSAAPESPPPPPTAKPVPSNCRIVGGDALIGYWYAGVQSPGAVGATITVPVNTNVRADYPDIHNQFNARAPVRCVLQAGTHVTLSFTPIRVPGDRYWVPLRGADVKARR